jgi:hypothetical protein
MNPCPIPEQPPKCKFSTTQIFMNNQLMVLYNIMSTLLNVLLMFLNAPLTFVHDPLMLLHAPLTFLHVPPIFVEDLQTFDDIPLMHSKILLGFNHQPWAFLP